MCSFLVTITMLMTNPVSPSHLPKLEVKQYAFETFLKANQFSKDKLLEMGAGLSTKQVPRINGVDIQEVQPFKCK